MAWLGRWLRLARLLVALVGAQEIGAASAAELLADEGLARFRSELSAGKLLLKQRQTAEALDRLKQALATAHQAALGADEQSVAQYLLGLALVASDRDGEAIVALQQSLKLTPDDSECRLELAQALLRQQQYAQAQQQATAALASGLRDPVDQHEAKALLGRAQSARLHERFTADLLVSIGFDSNVLESATATAVSGQCASGCKQQRPQPGISRLGSPPLGSPPRTPAPLRSQIDYPSSVRRSYQEAQPAPQQWDLPTSLQLVLQGRLLGWRSVELWTGYRFYQYLLPGLAFDHDAYNLQEHSLPLLLTWQPVDWLRLRAKLDGFFNFSGLKQLTPFQAGLRGSLDGTAILSAHLRARATYLHQYRRSLDRAEDGYLDGQRDELRLTGELRLDRPALKLRGQLGYRLHSERTGAYSILRDLQKPLLAAPLGSGPSDGGTPLTWGTFDYSAPLGYLGHELGLHLRLLWPLRFELAASFAYEYRRYDGLYSATFSPSPTLDLALGPPRRQLAELTMPAQQRTDSLLRVELAPQVHLAGGFSIEIAYAYLRNFSNIANLIDNRSYDKHSIVLSGLYGF